MDNLIINVNSKFTNQSIYTPSNFVFDIGQTLKNIAYIRLGSIEFPTTTYNFLSEKKNTSFKIGDGSFEETITLPDGNYTSDSILLKIQDSLDVINTDRSKNYNIDIDINKGKIIFTSDDTVNINFTNEDIGYGSLGYHMGFSNNSYSGTSIEGDNVINLNSTVYFFLKINNIDNIIDNNVKNAFAKIIQTTGSFNFTIEGKADYVAKEKVFRSPINLSKLEVQVVDYMDRVIDLNGIDLSFTLEVGYIYDKKLYESINNRGIPNGDNRLKYYY